MMDKEIILPLQPIVDRRFVPNKIVQHLLDNGPFDMNQLAVMDFTKQEHVQFAQLIGYSLGGFADLSYVDDESYGAAERMSRGMTEPEARNEELRETLNEVRNGLRISASAAFRIHPEDLEV